MENNIILKITKYTSYGLMALAGIFVVAIWYLGDELETSESLQSLWVTPYFYISYIALAICFILALAFPIVYMIMNPKNAVRMLMVLAGMVVLALISYAFAGNQFTADQLIDMEISDAGSRRVGAALIFTYIIGVLTILAAIYSAVSKLFK